MQLRTLSLLLAAALAVGCQKSETAGGSTPSESAAVASPTGDAPIYRNAKGEILCPVMNKVIASEADAKGSQVYDGTKYLFCCGMCPGKFKENPKLYAKS